MYILSSIILLGQIEFFGEQCFSDCRSVCSLEIPISTKLIPKQGFVGWSSLQNISFLLDDFVNEDDFYNTPFNF